MLNKYFGVWVYKDICKWLIHAYMLSNESFMNNSMSTLRCNVYSWAQIPSADYQMGGFVSEQKYNQCLLPRKRISESLRRSRLRVKKGHENTKQFSGENGRYPIAI